MNKRLDDILAFGHPGRETDRARNTIELAVKCADELGDNVFDSCHLIAGLYREGNGVAYHVLNNLGVKRSQIDSALEARERAKSEDFRIDDDIRKVLNAAFAAASEMSHSYIGTEHLLIGATTDGSKSALLIAELGQNPRDVKNDVFDLLGDGLP